jgi:ubiquinone/menaquinone biosynthesis C-methylase UbiE
MTLPDFFFEIHKDLPREAPGDDASTAQAYALLPKLPDHPQVLDVGCGTGAQTLVLARLSGGQITAVDTHKPFLKALNVKAAQQGLAGRISTLPISMKEMNFSMRSFDLIWSEGAIYIMGFDEGLREWKRLLKPGGCIAVTECSWFKPNPPEELRAFWEANYPAMRSVEDNLASIKRLGYQVLGWFALPESSWWDNYYHPLQQRVAALRAQYAHDAEAVRLLDTELEEIDLYQRYAEWYGYAFYVMHKAE